MVDKMDDVLLLFIFSFLYIIILHLVFRKILKRSMVSYFDTAVSQSVFVISLSLLFIYITSLSWTEAGFQTGEITSHFIIAAFIGIAFCILNFFLISKCRLRILRDGLVQYLKNLKGIGLILRSSYLVSSYKDLRK